MTHRVDVARGRDIIARWCNLAEQRLEYLTELFESGRWRRFHTERAFLENIREAKVAVETWRDLLRREASLDNSAMDMSGLGRVPSMLPGRDRLPERVQLHQPKSVPVPVEPPPRAIPDDMLAALERQLIASDQAPCAASDEAPCAPAPDEAPLPTLDLNVMQQRYPLLRNAL